MPQPKNSRILYNDLQTVPRCPDSGLILLCIDKRKNVTFAFGRYRHRSYPGAAFTYYALFFLKRGYKSRCSDICSGRIYLFLHTQVMRRIRAAANARHSIVLISSGTDLGYSEKEAVEGRKKQPIEYRRPACCFSPFFRCFFFASGFIHLQKISPSHYAGR